MYLESSITNKIRGLFLSSALLVIVLLLSSCEEVTSIIEQSSNESGLYIPSGQQFNGAIQTRGADTYYSVDTAPLIAYGGSPLAGYTWSVANLSTLPVGTAVDPLTGILHANGGKMVGGTHTFEMVVSDGSKTATGKFTFIVTTGEMVGVAVFQQPSMSTISLPNAVTGKGYGAGLRALGDGELPWSWYLGTGELPPGLEIERVNGIVRGTPFSSAAGNTYSFTIIVKDKNGEEALIVTPNGQPPTYTIYVAR